MTRGEGIEGEREEGGGESYITIRIKTTVLILHHV